VAFGAPRPLALGVGWRSAAKLAQVLDDGRSRRLRLVHRAVLAAEYELQLMLLDQLDHAPHDGMPLQAMRRDRAAPEPGHARNLRVRRPARLPDGGEPHLGVRVAAELLQIHRRVLRQELRLRRQPLCPCRRPAPPASPSPRPAPLPIPIAATFRATTSASTTGPFRLLMAPVLYHGAPPAGSNPESGK